MAVINNQYLEPLRISIYGRSKVGKTTLAAGIPGCHVLNFANVEVEDSDGWTPLHYASNNNHIKVAKNIAKQCHANVEFKDING